MPKLKNVAAKGIRDILESSRFTAADFTLTLLDSDQEGDGKLVSIKFDAVPSYCLDIWFDDINGNYEVFRRPGREFAEEIENFGALFEATGVILGWCSDIQQELQSMVATDDAIGQIRADVLRQIDDYIESTPPQFTQQEIVALREQLAKMADQFESLKIRADESEDLLAELRRDISQLLDDLETYPKDVWLRTAGNKLLSIATRFAGSKEVREMILSAAKSLMPGQGSP